MRRLLYIGNAHYDRNTQTVLVPAPWPCKSISAYCAITEPRNIRINRRSDPEFLCEPLSTPSHIFQSIEVLFIKSNSIAAGCHAQTVQQAVDIVKIANDLVYFQNLPVIQAKIPQILHILLLHVTRFDG